MSIIGFPSENKEICVCKVSRAGAVSYTHLDVYKRQ